MYAKKIVPTITELRYMMVDFAPRSFLTTEIVTILVAGPALKKTKAAPGEKPVSMRVMPIGIEVVAQTYSGIEISSTNI